MILLLAGGCGSSSGAADDGGVVPDSSGRPCTSASNCPGKEICHPTTGQCTAGVTCQEHDDCGVAAHCDSSGICEPSRTGSPCAGDQNCLGTERCTGGFCGCEGEAFSAERVPPNMLIVLDRSSSMNQSLGGGQTRWTVALAAIAELLAQFGDEIRFGLSLYPGTNQTCSQGASCTAGAVFVPPGEDTAAEINEFLAGANRCSFGTPTAAMLDSLLGFSGLADPTRPNYVLLVTDGESTCNNNPTDEVEALRAQTPEVKTFVIGFVDGDPNELDAMATAGGTAIAGGPPFYYDAQDAAQLASAFATIAGSVLSCTYTLSDTPADASALYVYQDRGAIPRDTSHADGWDYDAATNQVTFYGPSCAALQSGAVTDLVIVYGCPLVIE